MSWKAEKNHHPFPLSKTVRTSRNTFWCGEKRCSWGSAYQIVHRILLKIWKLEISTCSVDHSVFPAPLFTTTSLLSLPARDWDLQCHTCSDCQKQWKWDVVWMDDIRIHYLSYPSLRRSSHGYQLVSEPVLNSRYSCLKHLWISKSTYTYKSSLE